MKKQLIAAHMALALLAGFMTVPAAAQPEEQKKLTPAEHRKQLHTNVETAVAKMKKTDPGVDRFFKDSVGYAVFPRVGKIGFIIGGGHGDGELFEGGRAVGATSVTLGSVGLQAGVQEFSQIVFFEDRAALDRFKQNKFEFSANASAVVAKAGAAVAAKYNNGVAVFVEPTAGVMAEASVGAQKFKYVADADAPKKK